MPDCTHIPNRLSRRRGAASVAGIAIAAILAIASTWPAVAHADGDPASDVLASQPVFLPQDAGIPAAQQSQLAELVAAARRSGYPIRVALIASPTDLGSVSALWRQPGNYARFLGQELSLVYGGPLLVVMPNGIGLFGAGQAAAGADASVRTIAPSSAGGLGSAALTAIQRLAAAGGHPLTVARATTTSTAGSQATVPWIVFAVGVALIAAAWGASLRARPLRR